MARVAITGSEGTIGRVLTGRSKVDGERTALQANVTRIDVGADKGGSEALFVSDDLSKVDRIRTILRSHDVLIHAAWSAESVLVPDVYEPANVETVARILGVAKELGSVAAKVVLLSSVNAHVPVDWKTRRAAGDFISTTEMPTPYRHNQGKTPSEPYTRYGQSKLAIEQMAIEAAASGLHVVTPRIGGVNLADRQSSTYPPHLAVYADPIKGKHFDPEWEDAARLRHSDLITDMQRLVDTSVVPRRFERYNLVSDTENRVHVL